MNPDKLSKSNELAHKLMSGTRKAKKEDKPSVGDQEIKSLIKNKYSDKSEENSYVIQNTKTKQIVEIKASSPLLAAKIVGWRPRHVKLIQTNPHQKD